MVQLTAAKCPQCGADIEVNAELEKSICQYCGTTILVQEAIQKIELSGSVKVEGIKNRDDYLNQAKKHFKVGEYLEAIENLSYIISDDSFDIESYCELIKNYYMILKNNNYDFKITSYNKDYDRSDNTYYDDLISTMDRLDKIDEKNEREKYFDNFQDEKNELLAIFDDLNKRKEENAKKIEKMNTDLEKVKEINYFKEYSKFIGETFKTVTTIDNCNHAESGDDYDCYVIQDYAELTTDGLLVVNYKKTTNYYKNNPDIYKACWKSKSESSTDYNEIDERYNKYCEQIDSIIEKNRLEYEKIEKGKERSRKWTIIKSLLGIIGAILIIGFIIFMNIYNLNAYEDLGPEIITFILSCIFVPGIFIFFISCIDDLIFAIKSKKKK